MLLVVVIGGCGEVEVRMCNGTRHDLASLDFGYGEEGALAKTACTPYRTAEDPVYDITNVRLVIGTDVFQQQIIDHVGDEPLAPGRWSYHVYLDDFTRSIHTTIVADD